MKRLIIITVTLAVLFVPVYAEDAFLDGFNFMAETTYKVQTIYSAGDQVYTSGRYVVSISDNTYTVFGADHLEVISAACCILRLVDISGKKLDQYGVLMNAFFNARMTGKQMEYTIDNGTTIRAEIKDDFLVIGMTICRE